MSDITESKPSDGHTFRFRIDIRPSSKVVGDPEYTDGPDFMGPVHEVQVRAWSLTAALQKAADLPFGVLMGNLVSDDALDARRCPRCDHALAPGEGDYLDPHTCWPDQSLRHNHDADGIYDGCPACGTVRAPDRTSSTPQEGHQ
jgi:hypothetical protein